MTAASSAAPPAVIHIGQIILARGNLNYTDNFIKPNYTANITQLAGKIGAFGTASGGPPAPLTLEGQIDDNAPVNIDGTINPLTPVTFLDVKGKADGVELTHLTPYSSKYTGYPIIKGRLTMDVHYALDQGKLNADNHIFLSQLTFGDRVEGKGISHLPVKLAVALLKDSQGNIDVDIPVTGSLSDPHFSFGSLIWHAFVNLIGRAVTSPFRLIASAMSGNHQDLGYVEFAPGSNVLDAQAKDRLTQIAKILTGKPSLNLDIIGRADPKFDEDGLRKVMMQQQITHELAKDQGGDESDVSVLSKLSPDDYNKYLSKAYKHAKFSKPRDLIGLTKSQPPDVMEKLLQTNVTVDQDALRHLAERRADAVRQWLHGKVDDKRVFVSAPKLDAKGIDDKGKTTRADFGLH
jgi:outer membrane protein OmpA-like peptidoglycan-associated protein